MKGATADPSVNTKRVLKNTRKMMMGASHHFLRTLRKSQNSGIIESLDMVKPKFLDFNVVILSA